MTNRFSQRFDGIAAFAKLPNKLQIKIGGIALELVLSWVGQDAYAEPKWVRPFEAAEPLLFDLLQNVAEDAIPAILDQDILPIPSHLGQTCEVCGCSEQEAPGHTYSWVSTTLCSTCTTGDDQIHATAAPTDSDISQEPASIQEKPNG
jgi:hypothetical protein